MDIKTIQQIVNQANERLSQLLEEDKAADLIKEKITLEMRKAQAVIDLFASYTEKLPTEKPHGANGQSPAINLPPPPVEPNTVWFRNWANETWEERVKAYFKHMNKVLTISEIVDAFRPHVSDDYSVDKLKGAVTNAVAIMNKKELLRTYHPGYKMRGFYYGNPLWFEGDKLKEEHKPDLKKKLLW